MINLSFPDFKVWESNSFQFPEVTFWETSGVQDLSPFPDFKVWEQVPGHRNLQQVPVKTPELQLWNKVLTICSFY